MATKAYFMIRIKEGLHNNGRIEEMIGELEAIPEVICVEPIDGICDLLAQVEAPIRAVFVANKVMAKEWVKDLRMLKVEPLYTEVHDETAVPNVLKEVGKHLEQLETTSLSEFLNKRSSLVKEAEKIIRRRR